MPQALKQKAGYLAGSAGHCHLSDVERIEDQNMLIVFWQRDNVALSGHAQPAATTHLDVRALKLTNERSVALEHRQVEPVAVAIADKNIAGIAGVNSARKRRDWLIADVAQILTFLGEYHNTMSLNTSSQQTII